MTPEQIATATKALIEGKTQEEAAALANVPRTTMLGHVQKDEIQQLIKSNQMRFIQDALSKAVTNQIDKINISKSLIDKIQQDKDLPKAYKTYAELGHDAEKQLLQSVGIHSAHTQSVVLNNIMIDARSEMSPAVEALLLKHLSIGSDNADVIEVSSIEQKD